MTEDQIIAQELARLSKTNTMTTTTATDETTLYTKLASSFPKEAYSVDSSRGFDLTSIKAQFVVERLNEAFGFMNWTFGGEYKDNEEGILFLGALVVTVNGRQNKVFAPGFSAKKKNLGDAYKGANTDSLCKCASRIGIGNEVFKGLVNPSSIKLVTNNTKPKRVVANSDASASEEDI